ncbi:hypothetical protein IT568_03540, partial [bacterium]|nr:hypothetical protein [bacterium]
AGKDYEAASSEVEVKSAKDRSSKWKAVSIVSYGIGGASLFGAIFSFVQEKNYRNDLEKFSLVLAPNGVFLAVNF